MGVVGVGGGVGVAVREAILSKDVDAFGSPVFTLQRNRNAVILALVANHRAVCGEFPVGIRVHTSAEFPPQVEMPLPGGRIGDAGMDLVAQWGVTEKIVFFFQIRTVVVFSFIPAVYADFFTGLRNSAEVRFRIPVR